MKLNVLERVMLGSILPPETNFSQYKIITALKLQISFDEKETKEFGITQTVDKDGNGQVNWTKNEEREFTFGLTAIQIIREVLKKLDEEKKITANIGTLYEKFMGE
ncbi:hypothetical protein LCGC14_1425190 [marine sediment metagenome]|uniref:Uncharacterized protein n=1 Tax=marine sediment metagenome TaxID=412755 RepID=A0A0F9JQ32_9ZZZZ